MQNASASDTAPRARRRRRLRGGLGRLACCAFASSLAFALASPVAREASAALVSFVAQDGELDVSHSDLRSAKFEARRDWISGWARWSRADAAELDALRRSDDRRYRTLEPGRGDNAAMLFEAVFDDDPEAVSSIDLHIEVAQADRDGLVFVYLWSQRHERYETIGRVSGTGDQTLDFTIDKHFDRYLGNDGRITILLVNDDDGGPPAHIEVDHLDIRVTSTRPRLTLAHAESASTCEQVEISIELQRDERGDAPEPRVATARIPTPEDRGRRRGRDRLDTWSPGRGRDRAEPWGSPGWRDRLDAWSSRGWRDRLDAWSSQGWRDLLDAWSSRSGWDRLDAWLRTDQRSPADRRRGPVAASRPVDARDEDDHGTIKISTSTGEGTWTLIQGEGSLVDGGGGVAKYHFAERDAGRVRLGLVHTSPGTVELSVTDGLAGADSTAASKILFEPAGEETLRDFFVARTYSGDDGTASWSGDWIEVGESDGPGAGFAMISDNRCASGACLRIGTPFSGQTTFEEIGVERAADLSRATRATLRFAYLRGHNRGAGVAWVQVSADGGRTFETLERYTLAQNTTSPIRQSFDITPWISPATRIRFVASVKNAATSIYVDDVEVEYESTCVSQDHFVIEHDGQATPCQEEPFSLTAMTTGDATLTTYDESVTLTTGTGTGGFTSAATNRGTFSDPDPRDGLASYTFSPKDLGTARFGLVHDGGGLGAGSALDLDVYESGRPGIEDDDREGPLVFSASGLVLTANPLPEPPPAVVQDPIGPRIAGRDFAVHLALRGATSATATCSSGVDPQSGPMKVSLWSQHHDPRVGTQRLVVDGVAIGTREAEATTLPVQFVKGRAKLAVRYKDVGRIQLHARLERGEAAAKPVVGSTDAFVSVPADLVVREVTRSDGSPNPGSTGPDAKVFVAAGEAFRVTVQAVDAEGDPTPGFGRESVPEGLRLVSAELVAPVGGRNGSRNDGAIGNATRFAAENRPGTFSGSAFHFDEVGAIRLQARIADGDYLGVGDVAGTPSGIVGRFTPSRFEVVANAPRWRTGCALGAFSWAGQPLRFVPGEEPVLSVRAVNADGGTTRNYQGEWWRLTNASLANRRYAIGRGSLDLSGLPDAANDPLVARHAPGEGTLTFSAGAGLVVARQPAFAPFEAELELSIDVVDLDGVAWPGNPFRVGGTQPGTGMAFDVSKRVQLGRLRLENAAGSERVDLPMALHTQVFDGTAFVDDDDDSCSRIAEAHLALERSPTTLGTAPSIARQPLFAGQAGLVLSAPEAVGEVEIRVDLGPGGADLPWLRFDWPEDGVLDGRLDDDPRARATFGIWGGREGLIYQREVY